MSSFRGAIRPPVVIAGVAIALVVAIVFVLFTDSGTPGMSGASGDEAAQAKASAPTSVRGDGDGEFGRRESERAETTADEFDEEEVVDEGAIPDDATGLTGRAIGRNGKPRAGVTVRVHRDVRKDEASRFAVTVRPGKWTARYERSAESEADGTFTIIDLLPASGYVVSLDTDDGLLARIRDVEVLEKLVDDVGDIALRSGARVSGMVRSESGGAVAGAEVTIGWWSGDPFVSDEDGRFDAGVVLPGRHNLTVKASGYALAESEEHEFVEGDVIDDLELVLVRAAPLVGRVRDDLGRPVVDAWITATRQDEDRGWSRWYGDTAQSGPDGRFVIASIAGGTYEVGFSADGFRAIEKSGVVAGGPPIEVTLDRSGVIEGVVVDATTSAPLKPERVDLLWVSPWDDSGGFQDYWGSVALDIRDDGTFFLAIDDGGLFKVEAWAEGYSPATSDSFTLEENGSISGVVVRLEPGNSLDVTVLDDDTAEPVKDAVVELYAAEGGQGQKSVFFNGVADIDVMSSRMWDGGSTRLGRAISDGNGVASLKSLKAGRFVVKVRKQDFAPGEATDIEVVAGQRPDPVEVRLTRGGSIEGRITNTQGGPEPAMKVAAVGNDKPSQTGVSLEGGQYRIDHLLPGRYRVDARPEGGMYVFESSKRKQQDGREIPEAERYPVVVEEGQVTHFDLTVEQIVPGSIAGVVLMNGAPMVRMRVTASFQEPSRSKAHYNWGWNNRVTTDDLGRFRFRRLRPGRYVLSVHQGWRRGYAGGEVHVAANNENQVTINITLGGVTGRVLDHEGHPLADAQVTARPDPSGSSGRLNWWGGESVNTAADGSFTVEELQAGPFDVSVRRRGYKTHTERGVSVAAHRLAGPLVISLQPGGWLKVRMTGAGVEPAALAEMHFSCEYHDPDGNRRWRRWETPDNDGFLWLENHADEAGVLTVSGETWNDQSKVVLVGSAEIRPRTEGITEVEVQLQ